MGFEALKTLHLVVGDDKDQITDGKRELEFVGTKLKVGE
jgi:hypothetical protein